jgi:hypothetical protein
MPSSHRRNGCDFDFPLERFVFTTFFLSFFRIRALAAQDQPSAQAILQHFYQAAGGSAWQHYEECDSEGTTTVAGKTGSLRYIEDLHNGANVSQAEIRALNVKQADGDGPMQSWDQDVWGRRCYRACSAN